MTTKRIPAIGSEVSFIMPKFGDKVRRGVLRAIDLRRRCPLKVDGMSDDGVPMVFLLRLEELVREGQS